MLTLASNERIPLTPSMRLLLEINHMNHCSPATGIAPAPPTAALGEGVGARAGEGGGGG